MQSRKWQAIKDRLIAVQAWREYPALPCDRLACLAYYMAIMPEQKRSQKMFVNIEGIYHIQKWIDENQEKNPRVFDLWANGIASEIDRSDTVAQELRDNGYFSYEIGLKDGQGRSMVIDLYPEHFRD